MRRVYGKAYTVYIFLHKMRAEKPVCVRGTALVKFLHDLVSVHICILSRRKFISKCTYILYEAHEKIIFFQNVFSYNQTPLYEKKAILTESIEAVW